MIFEILLIVALTILNGLLAMSELAVVSSRPVRLKVLQDQKVRGAAAAIKLAETPGRFLSAVQIGITLVGILNGALSGATLGQRVAQWLLAQGMDVSLANPLGVGVVVVLITYFSLIIGELVPKQIALKNPEGIAATVAPTMAILSIITTPLVVVLDWSGNIVLTILGQGGKNENRVTEEEVRGYIAEAEHAGVIKTEEHSMISGVMRFADRSAQGLMTPRREVEILNLADDPQAIIQQLLGTRHSRLPVQDGDADAIIGIVLVRDVLPELVEKKNLDVRQHVLEAPVVLDQLDALAVLQSMRQSTVHLALVYDEYGHFEGIITAGDVLESITGAFLEEGDETPAFVTRDDGSYLVEGWMPVDEFAESVGMPLPQNTDYETVAGLVLSEIRHMPKVGEQVKVGDLLFEVIDLDGRRVDKVLVTPQPIENDNSESSAD